MRFFFSIFFVIHREREEKSDLISTVSITELYQLQ